MKKIQSCSNEHDNLLSRTYTAPVISLIKNST